MSKGIPSWFKDAKYGLFIHWGLYAIPAGEYHGKTSVLSEWLMNLADIPVEEYEKWAKEFNPVNFDADKIVKSAKDWGMKYIVFTSKHHDGFAMYDSKCSDYNVVKATPYGKDILKELQLACEKYDMKLGLYYSQAQDWHDPNGYVQYRDNSHKDYQSYLDNKVKPQLKEILTQYGDIGLIWFDTPMDSTKEQSEELVKLVKELQPDCLVSGRIGNGLGDYMTTGDNYIPLLPYDEQWELPASLNDSFGYHKLDHNWKSPEDVIKLLIKVTGRGGNYLLNIGPDALGDVPEKSKEILDEVGKYARENAEAIYGTELLDVYPYDLSWALFTQRPHRLFIHVISKIGRVDLLGVANKVKRVYLLSDGRELEAKFSHTCEHVSRIEFEIPDELKDKAYYCVGLELEEEKPIYEPIIK